VCEFRRYRLLETPRARLDPNAMAAAQDLITRKRILSSKPNERRIEPTLGLLTSLSIINS